ncbi:MAG: histidine--tRNA ligase [Candidatus Diapherotrites archaeon]|nr:histidine--tRNA ligase [Candidatus Diapherotrites archaeon]
MQLSAAKGTRDFLPEQMILRQRILSMIRETFEIYGFSPLETPAMEMLDTLTAKFAAGTESDDIKEIFRFKDQGQRELGLRFDLTVPFSRVVGMNPTLKMPFKRYQIQNVYRDGPLTTNRYREFLQCDADVVGVESVKADAEILALAQEVFRKLGIGVEIRINSRRFLTDLMEYLKIPEEKRESVLVSVDKLDKMPLAEVKTELQKRGLREEQATQLLELMNLSGTNGFKLKAFREKLGEGRGIQGIEELLEYCAEFGCTPVFFPTLVRGLAYYTGPIFEAVVSEGTIKGSVAGGGRYDRMIGQFLGNGKEFPATGISFGIERIFDAFLLKQPGSPKTVTRLYVVFVGVENIAWIRQLRENKIRADFNLDKKSISKALDYASKNGIPFVAVIGEKELSGGKFRLRNMESGQETELALGDFKSIRERIQSSGGFI